MALDPLDAGIEEAIQRLERKSFIKDGLIPEVQCLLAVPPARAKEAYLAQMTQYSLVSMLILASLLGSALNPLSFEAYPDSSPSAVASFNLMSMIISCACLFGTCIFVLEGIIVEGTPADRIHSIIAKADGTFHFGTCMVAAGLQGTAPLIILRAWISGLDRAQCIVLTAICGCFYFWMTFTYFRHLQTHWPVEAQRWTKLFAPFLYRREKSSAAVDELVAELRYLQQPRERTLTPAQLGACLDDYFGALSSARSDDAGALCGPDDQALLHADQSAFLQLVEGEAGGRLAPMMERLAKKTFEKAVEAALEKLAGEAIGLQTRAI